MIMATASPEIQSDAQHFEIQHDRTVREEIETFRVRAGQFLAGQITEDEFRPFRLKHGIYGQRQPGVQMVRCKVPGGLLTAPQVSQLARIADEFAGGKAHLTTRQNIQYHFIPLAHVAGLMHLLADVGMTNREACYNTVRNVTACPWSGIAHDEVFDVRPYAPPSARAAAASACPSAVAWVRSPPKRNCSTISSPKSTCFKSAKPSSASSTNTATARTRTDRKSAG